jgi:hypothetical protein
MPTTAGWEDECGPDCSMLWNSVQDIKQTLIINWIDKEQQNTNQGRNPSWHMYGQNHYWRLNHSCYNVQCTF